MIFKKILSVMYGIFIWMVVVGIAFSCFVMAVSSIYSPQIFGFFPSFLLFIGLFIIAFSLAHDVYVYFFIKCKFPMKVVKEIGLSEYIYDDHMPPTAFLFMNAVLEKIPAIPNSEICENLLKISGKIAARQKLLGNVSFIIIIILCIAFVLVSIA